MVIFSLKKLFRKEKEKEKEEEYWGNDNNENYEDNYKEDDYTEDNYDEDKKNDLVTYGDIKELISDDEDKNSEYYDTSIFKIDDLETPFSDLFSIKSNISTEPQYESTDLVYNSETKVDEYEEYIKIIDMLLYCYDY